MATSRDSSEDYSVPDEHIPCDALIRAQPHNARIQFTTSSSNPSSNASVDSVGTSASSVRSSITNTSIDAEAENRAPLKLHSGDSKDTTPCKTLEDFELDQNHTAVENITDHRDNEELGSGQILTEIHAAVFSEVDETVIYSPGATVHLQGTENATEFDPIPHLLERMRLFAESSIQAPDDISEPHPESYPLRVPPPKVDTCPSSSENSIHHLPGAALIGSRDGRMYHTKIPPKPPNQYASNFRGKDLAIMEPHPNRFLDSYGRPLTEGFDGASSQSGARNVALRNMNSAPSNSTEGPSPPIPRRRPGAFERRMRAILSPDASAGLMTDRSQNLLRPCERPPLLQCPNPARVHTHTKAGVISGRLTIYGPINLKWNEMPAYEYRDALPKCSVLRREGIILRRNWGKETLDIYRIYTNGFS